MHWAERRPNAPWLFQPQTGQWQRTTWAEADAQVRRMATALLGLGLEPGTRIAISGLNTAHWFWPIWRSRWPAMSASACIRSSRPSTSRYILEHSESRACFSGR
jgi:long-chain acyl-CoA synthetase